MEHEPLPPAMMRASNTDRTTVARHLAHAFQEGRLTLSEYHERLDSALTATTMGDLGGLTGDLPAPPPVLRRPPERELRSGSAPGGRRDDRSATWRRRMDPWRGLTAISIVLVSVWAVTSVIAGELLVFWPLVPMGFLFVFTFAAAVGRPPDHGARPDRPWPPIDGR